MAVITATDRKKHNLSDMASNPRTESYSQCINNFFICQDTVKCTHTIQGPSLGIDKV